MRRNTKPDEGTALLLRLAAFLDEQEKETAARWFRLWTDEISKGPSRKRRYEIACSMIGTLGAGSGRLSDLYFAHPDGTPDVQRSDEYLQTIRAARRFARRLAAPWTYFLWR